MDIICFTNHCQDKRKLKFGPEKLPVVAGESSYRPSLAADLKQEMGKRVPVRTNAKLRAAAGEHMAMLEQNSERVIGYFQDCGVRYSG